MGKARRMASSRAETKLAKAVSDDLAMHAVGPEKFPGELEGFCYGKIRPMHPVQEKPPGSGWSPARERHMDQYGPNRIRTGDLRRVRALS